MNTEETQINTKNQLYKIMIISLLVSIKIMQLVLSRDGQINREGSITFSEKELNCMQTVIKKYEGKTEKQKNPYPHKSLAWCCWIIARIGGWKGYRKSEGPPGPITLRDGLCRFKSIFEGWQMAMQL